jgi:hypothetical protein
MAIRSSITDEPLRAVPVNEIEQHANTRGTLDGPSSISKTATRDLILEQTFLGRAEKS